MNKNHEKLSTDLKFVGSFCYILFACDEKAWYHQKVNLKDAKNIGRGNIMETHKHERSTFSGKLGFVLSAAGASVGLGNIWSTAVESFC